MTVWAYGYRILFAGFLLLFAACQTVTETRAVTDDPAPTATTAPAVVDPAVGYKLGNGDQIRVTVFDEEELSGEFQVDGTGNVSLPLVGEIKVVGKTVREFQQEFQTRLLNDGYLLNPRVAAEVITFRPFYILGEINRPGEYPYTDDLTVLNAIATAEGFTYRAKKSVVFIRGAGESDERAVRLTPTLRVQPGDTIRIDERLF
ncbi:MAG: polysaccharide biosynthesis/export family protein [Pseudomonadota bacterium]